MTRSKAAFFVFVLAACPVFAAFAQYLPPYGTESYNSYLSPSFLSAGASVTSDESPQSDSINPAASGAKQRVTLDASYLG